MTTTPNKDIIQPAYNDYADVSVYPTGWAGPINNNWTIVDNGFGGVLQGGSLSTTGGTTNLNITQTQNLIFLISGTLASNATFTLPLNSTASAKVAGQWIVKNATTGAFTVTFAPISGGGTSTVISQGESVCIYCDGTNVAFADNPSSYITAAFAARSVLAGTAMTGGGPLSANVTITADQATDANWRTNAANKLLNANAVWAAMAETTLTDQASIPWNMQLGFDFIVTLEDNRALANPTNTKIGQKGRLIIRQGAAGSHTLTWGSSYKFANGTAPVLSTAPNSPDVLYYDVRESTYIIVTLAGRAFN